MAEPDRSTTERGFTIYDEFTDTYGSTIRVRESSLATEPCCWIFATQLATGTVATPHLNVGQAKRVRNALDTFIREHEDAGHG